MDASAVIAIVQQHQPALGDWSIFRINGAFVRRERDFFLRWTIILALLLLALVLGEREALLSGFLFVLLIVLGAVMLGCAWVTLARTQLLRTADLHLIVITDDALIQQRGKQLLAFPLPDIQTVITQGYRGENLYTRTHDPVRADFAFRQHDVEQSLYTPMPKRIPKNRVRRTRDLLAFVDARDGKLVTFLEDDRFGPIDAIANALRRHLPEQAHE